MVAVVVVVGSSVVVVVVGSGVVVVVVGSGVVVVVVGSGVVVVVVVGAAVVVVVVAEESVVVVSPAGKRTPPMKSRMGVGLVVVLMPRISCICALMMLTRICSRRDPMRGPENLSSSMRAPCSSAGRGEAKKGPANMRAGGNLERREIKD